MPTDLPEQDSHDETVDAAASASSPDADEADTPQDGTSDVDPMTAVEQERDQFRDQFLRTAAELENYRKRVNRERDEDRKYACLGLFADLLPALDNLERAVNAAATEDSDSNVLQGVQMVLKQFEEILSRHGAEEIPALNEPFDPNLHEALQQQPRDDVAPMTVIQVLQRGFKLRDRVIRPSQVIVSAQPAESTDSD